MDDDNDDSDADNVIDQPKMFGAMQCSASTLRCIQSKQPNGNA